MQGSKYDFQIRELGKSLQGKYEEERGSKVERGYTLEDLCRVARCESVITLGDSVIFDVFGGVMQYQIAISTRPHKKGS